MPVRKLARPKRTVRYHHRPYRMAPVRRKKMGVRDDNEEGRLLVSNIGPTTTLQMMKDMFAVFGNVGKIIMHWNSEAQAMTGTAEVWMSSGTDAARAKDILNATDAFVDGRMVRVECSGFKTTFCKYWKIILKLQKQFNKTNKENEINN